MHQTSVRLLTYPLMTRTHTGGWSMSHPVNEHLLPGKDDEFWDWSTAGKST